MSEDKDVEVERQESLGARKTEWAAVDYGSSKDGLRERKYVHFEVEYPKEVSDLDRRDQAIKEAAEEIWNTLVEDAESWPEESTPRILLNLCRARKVEIENKCYQIIRLKQDREQLEDYCKMFQRHYREIEEWVTQSFLDGASVERYQDMLNRHTKEYAALREPPK